MRFAAIELALGSVPRMSKAILADELADGDKNGQVFEISCEQSMLGNHASNGYDDVHDHPQAQTPMVSIQLADAAGVRHALCHPVQLACR
jgi:hypothetical protein